jgi:hypothetical protein
VKSQGGHGFPQRGADQVCMDGSTSSSRRPRDCCAIILGNNAVSHMLGGAVASEKAEDAVAGAVLWGLIWLTGRAEWHTALQAGSAAARAMRWSCWPKKYPARRALGVERGSNWQLRG